MYLKEELGLFFSEHISVYILQKIIVLVNKHQ